MYQSAVSSRAKMTSLGGLDIGEWQVRPVKDFPLITPLETQQVNSKLIAACQTWTISRDSYCYLEHPVIKLLDKKSWTKIVFFKPSYLNPNFHYPELSSPSFEQSSPSVLIIGKNIHFSFLFWKQH